ncbi:stage III sporulation protein AA [Clostridium massiliamazoniense]|uniref:stage III sporulation protein AA n=1 Tax=Clostridium massiliamazoniense TaxID=1347366 RepID=UPI000A007E0E
MDRIIRFLSKPIIDEVKSDRDFKSIEEIRIAIGKPIIVLKNNKEIIKNYRVTAEDMKSIIQRVSNYSIYAFEEEIKQGYITIEGGHRIGISGQCVIENGAVKTIKHIGSINIRVAREVIGCSNKLMKEIIDGNRINNTIIISPPKCGKTTLLRDITRNISNGYAPLKFEGKRTTVIDERSEIASCYRGIPQMNVGIRTDIYDNCIKSQGIIMAIRTMAPEVVVCDEIGTNKDIEALIMAYNSGVNVIVTIHGNEVEDIYKRPVFKDILDNKMIKKIIVLSNKDGIGTVESIITL